MQYQMTLLGLQIAGMASLVLSISLFVGWLVLRFSYWRHPLLGWNKQDSTTEMNIIRKSAIVFSNMAIVCAIIYRLIKAYG